MRLNRSQLTHLTCTAVVRVCLSASAWSMALPPSFLNRLAEVPRPLDAQLLEKSGQATFQESNWFKAGAQVSDHCMMLGFALCCTLDNLHAALFSHQHQIILIQILISLTKLGVLPARRSSIPTA